MSFFFFAFFLFKQASFLTCEYSLSSSAEICLGYTRPEQPFHGITKPYEQLNVFVSPLL